MKNLPKDQEEALLQAAWDVAAKAYAPYSGFPVGAAILTESGDVFTGCNVECAAYPHGVCAERTAASTAVSAGHQAFTAIAIVAKASDPTPPCGGCRQFLAEFAPDMFVIYSNGSQIKRTKIRVLLPELFEGSFLPSDE